MVTGSGRGFGRAIAQTLAAEGASVVVTARSGNEIDETVDLITKAGGKAVAAIADVTKRTDIEDLRAVAEKEFGTVTLAIHNAGVPWPFGPTWYVDPDRWWEAQTVHVRAAMYMIHTFVPAMVDGDGGRFIVVSSAGGVNVGPNISGYGVAKSTQIRIAQFLGAEGADKGVYAFAIHPGDVHTGISDLTMNDPDAQKYNAAFVERLTTRNETEEDRRAGFQACADLCAKLGSGAYDGLTGRYLRPDDDLDALLAAGGEVAGSSLGVVSGQ